MKRLSFLFLLLPMGSSTFAITQGCGWACTSKGCSSDVTVKQTLQVVAGDLDGATARICAADACDTVTLAALDDGNIVGYAGFTSSVRAEPNAAGGYDVVMARSFDQTSEPEDVVYTYALTSADGTTVLLEASGKPTNPVNDYPNGEDCDADSHCVDAEIAPSGDGNPIVKPVGSLGALGNTDT